VFSLSPTLATRPAPAPASLLDQARAGDAAAFGALCLEYEARLVRHAMGLCGNATLAEELAQDTLVEAWKSLARYHGGCQFFTWLCAILLNRYRNTRRQPTALPLSTLASEDAAGCLDHLAMLADPHARPDESAQNAEHAALVRSCLADLPPKLEQVVYLRFYVDDSLAEIATALGCSVGTVRSRLFNGLEKLRQMERLKAANHATNGETF
jgi:RNA polymerase sigma-70 factor (ECF subfamily)